MKKYVSIAALVLALFLTTTLSGFNRESTKAAYTLIYGSYTAPYARFVNVNQLTIYDDTPGGLVAPGSATYTETAVALTDYSTTTKLGGWLIVIPDECVNGQYDILIYDNAVPAFGDSLVKGFRCSIGNGKITEMTDF